MGIYVVAVCGPGLPVGGLTREGAAHHVPVEHGAFGKCFADTWEAGLMREEHAESRVFFAFGGELGPSFRNWRVKRKLAALDERQN